MAVLAYSHPELHTTALLPFFPPLFSLLALIRIFQRTSEKKGEKRKEKNFTTHFHIHKSRASVWYAIPPKPTDIFFKNPHINSFYSFSTILYYTYSSDDVCLSHLVRSIFILLFTFFFSHTLFFFYKEQKEGRKE